MVQAIATRRKFEWAIILVAALFAGACGIWPHLWFAAQTGTWLPFINSYDEGYYGWRSVTEPVQHKLLTSLLMQGIALLSGWGVSGAMILSDFLFPFFVCLGFCFALRPISGSALSAAAWAYLVMLSAELLTFRSTLSPTFAIFKPVRDYLDSSDSALSNLMVYGNETPVFWLFRTPEPQVSWIFLSLIIGTGLRVVLQPHQKSLPAYCMAVAVGATGYFFIILPTFGVLALAGFGIWLFCDRSLGLKLMIPPLIGGIAIVALAARSAHESGADAVLFYSRQPALMVSGVIGPLIAVIIGAVCLRNRKFSPMAVLGMAMAMSPLLMANQHLVTGRMIYLLNFENYGFSQILALSIPVAWWVIKGSIGRPRLEFLPFAGAAVAIVALGLMGWILFDSQRAGFKSYFEENQQDFGYAEALWKSELTPEDLLDIDDVFVACRLPVKLGWKPNFLLARSQTFSVPIGRMQRLGDKPEGREGPQKRLFKHLALNGIEPHEFNEWFGAVVDPKVRNWQGRFLIGGFLYNQADFWEPLTHSRNSRLDWIAAERETLVGQYKHFLFNEFQINQPIHLIGKLNQSDFERLSELGDLEVISTGGIDEEISIVRLLPNHSHRHERKIH